MKVEITQLHGSVYEKDTRVKIQQLQKQNERLHHILNQCKKHKHLISNKVNLLMYMAI